MTAQGINHLEENKLMNKIKENAIMEASNKAFFYVT
jgi:hypothetical protein